MDHHYSKNMFLLRRASDAISAPQPVQEEATTAVEESALPVELDEETTSLPEIDATIEADLEPEPVIPGEEDAVIEPAGQEATPGEEEIDTSAGEDDETEDPDQ
jgi:hypothetical protein